MALVTTSTSSGSGLGPEDRAITSSSPARALTSLTPPVAGSSVNVPTNEYGAHKTDYMGLTPYSGETGSGLVDLNKMFDELTVSVGKIAQEQMTGAIPEDVQKQLRIMRAESNLQAGLGSKSQASRNAVARDLGLTSLDIQERGVQKAQATAQLAESKRQFNKGYELNMAQFMQDVRRTDLSAAELSESSRQFNTRTKLMAAELAAATTSAYHQASWTFVSPDTADTAFSAWQQDMAQALEKINNVIT